VLHEAPIGPEQTELPDQIWKEAQVENAQERIKHGGPGLELLRRVYVERLRSHMEAFYEHASAGDVFALCAAFDLSERARREKAICARDHAALVEAFLATLGLDPNMLLNSGSAETTRLAR
jgi:hypothetical protein